MKLLLILLPVNLLLFMLPASYGQDVFSVGSRNESLAGATAALTGNWSVFGNQAGLASADYLTVGGSFQNRFLVQELSCRSGFIVVPVQTSRFAFSMSQFGQIPFRQEKFGLTYARKLGERLSFGVQFNWYRLFLSEENRSAGSFGAELGIQYRLTSSLIVGIHTVNPYQTSIKLSSGRFTYPSCVRVGAFYHFSKVFSMTSELENDFNDHFVLKTGFEYSILEKLFVRGGVSGKPYRISAGFGFDLKKLTLDLATTYNQDLGHSPSVSFQYRFK
jgi:hypothetical protein